MDYLLAAHIQVTGGAEASMQFSQLAVQINNFGKAAAGANTGAMATGLDKAAEAGGRFHGIVTQIGIALTRMATYQGIGLVISGLKNGVDAILDFDQQMTESLAIQTGVTDKMRDQMEALAKTIAVDLGLAPSKVAEGFYFLASAGLNVEQQLAALPVVANFAKAGMMSLEQATEKLYDSLTALGLKAKDPQVQMQNLIHLSDLLTVAAIESQGSVQDFTTALANKAGADMRTYGIDLEEGIALLEVFADRGIKGAKAGTAFDQIIRDMAIKAVANADAFKKFGIEVFDQQGNYNSLITIFGQFDRALLTMPIEQRTAALKELGFTLKGGQIIQSLLGTTGVLIDFKRGLEEAGGAAERVASQQMEALRAKLDQLKAMSAVFAIEGFEKMEEAALWLVATFSPAIQQVIDLLGRMAAVIGPVVGDMARLAQGAVVSGLATLAGVLDSVFGTISSNQSVVEALAYSLGALAGGAMISKLLTLGVTFGDFLAVRIMLAKDAIDRFFISMRTMDISSAIGGMKAAWSGFLDVLNSPIVVGTGIALFIAGLVKQYQDGKKAAREFADAATKGLDTGSLAGAEEAVRRVTVHIMDLRAQTQQFAEDDFWSKLKRVALTELDAVTPGFFKFSGNLLTLRGELAGTKDELATLTAARDNIATGFDMISDAMNRTGQFAGNTVYTFDATTTSMQEMAGIAQDLGLKVDTSAPALERLAAAAGIDISAGWQEWAPILEEAAIKSALVGDTTGVLADEMVTLSNEAAGAAEELKAFKSVLDEVFGTPMTEFESFTAAEQALFDLNSQLWEFTHNGGDIHAAFDATTKDGLAMRDSLSSAGDAAIKYVQSIADNQGIEAALPVLQEYRDKLVNVMMVQGLSAEEANKMADALGYTRENIEGVKTATGDGLAIPVTTPGAEEAKTTMDGLSGPRDAPISPKVQTLAELQAQDSLAELASARTASVEPFAAPGPVAATETTLTTTARKRDSQADQYATGWGAVENFFNFSSRYRTSNANQNPSGHDVTDYWFGWAARGRNSTATQDPNTAWAEYMLNWTARNRTSYIDVVVNDHAVIQAQQEAMGIYQVNAEGNIYKKYAGGGFENHIAQIGRGGVARMWNEPETGGEAYIPLAQSKRTRSMAIWAETGRLLGASMSGKTTTLNAPVTITVQGSNDPEATGRAVAAQAGKAIDQAMRRVLVEMQTI